MRRKKNELTFQENKFLNEYLKSGSGLKALSIAYPKSEKWTQNTKYVQVHKLLNNPLINIRIKEHNEAQKKAIENSTLLNKRKILEEIINLQTTAKNEKGQSMVNLQALKLLAQIAKMLDTSPTINNNIVVNNQNIDKISNFLDL